jgi:hypothetical protein
MDRLASADQRPLSLSMQRKIDCRTLQAALRSGAQVISSDYYPGAPNPLDLKFVISPPWCASSKGR